MYFSLSLCKIHIEYNKAGYDLSEENIVKEIPKFLNAIQKVFY